MNIDATTILTLQALEEAMWRTETRFDRRHMEAVLHPDFTEIGRSGRIFSRANVLEMPPVEISIEIPLSDLTFSDVADGAVLLTYTTVPERSEHGAARRASVWVREGERWLLRYHQGTPTSL
ncbi:nuclear transport factor 2 family protein [Demequina lutea]|uniref:Ribonuclease HI n=1 Tax=Demequina lutea TaxID=431489 RepID=A0A7Y9ZD15_9MICO|nr:nuclear transport factor 2 family protein [Demequina lutea]NYI41111.1 ribonuclease HI [Demequina lutea]